MDRTDLENQAKLKAALQEEKRSTNLEELASALLSRLLGVSIFVAKSGFQHGADAGSAGRQGRRLRVECKKYSDTTALSDRELLGEIDHALARDPGLEVWVLAATREVKEQLADDLNQKGESIGVPVIILDWKEGGLAELAGLCAFAPDIVASVFSNEAGELARALQPIAGDVISRIRRDLEAWSLGFETVRGRSIAKLEQIWKSPRACNAALGHDAAGGSREHRVRRERIHEISRQWWNGPARNDAPMAVVGVDGVGKTWAVLDWLVEREADLPIVLVVPSSAMAGLAAATETGIKVFVADRLYELTGVRDRDHWLARLDRLLKRPADEGPALTIFIDGLNQEPSVPWLSLFKGLQGDAFAGKIRVIASTRTMFFEDKLGSLRGLIVPATVAAVSAYDLERGGELDQMLKFEGLERSDLHGDLIPFARNPRLFQLVVRFRDRLIEAGQVTVHRLLWEYGRDTFGVRAGRSFSEAEWHAWLIEIARLYRDGIKEFSLKTLGESASRADLSRNEVYARLSDIIDGQFMIGDAVSGYRLAPMVVAHALGAGLLKELENVQPATFDRINSELTVWLDPIAGLDQRAEILRAAVSIFVERGATSAPPIGGALVTAWLQTQNVTDTHRRELIGLSASLTDPLLDAVEHSTGRVHTSARLWAMNALRSIDRKNAKALDAILGRSQAWQRIVSRDLHTGRLSADLEKSRSQRLLNTIGVDASGTQCVLGSSLQLVDDDDGVLAIAATSILEGFPLAGAAPLFEVAAVARSVDLRHQGWENLKWLCLLNENDPEETVEAIRIKSGEVKARVAEKGVNAALPARAASFLLFLTGLEEDERNAAEFSPGRLESSVTYETDYLAHPG